MPTLRPHQQTALDALLKYNLGQCVFPTGSGKTLVGIMDAKRQFASDTPKTIVVVAPRILLAEQLSSEYLEHITNAEVLHVHSGETHHVSTTKVDVIKCHHDVCKIQNLHQLIFTTYNSLHRIQEAEIEVTLSTLMRHITVSSVTSSLLLSISHRKQSVATSSLQLPNIL